MNAPMVPVFAEEYVTIRKIVEEIARIYHIKIREPNSGKRHKDCFNNTYRMMRQHIKRDLDAKIDIGAYNEDDFIKSPPGKRRHQYQRDFVYKVLSDKSLKDFEYLANKARQDEANFWREQAREIKKNYDNIMNDAADCSAAAQEDTCFPLKMENGLIVEDENWKKLAQKSQQAIVDRLEEIFQEKKDEIIKDYILRHCINLNENLLRHDISSEFTYSPANNDDGRDLQAIHRLKDLQNYYSIREKTKESSTDESHGNHCKIT